MSSEQGLPLALSQIAANDLHAAENTMRAYIAAHPGDADGHNFLGVICKRTGRVTEAVECFQQALALEKRHVPALLNLGRAHEAQGDLPRALEALSAARDLDPGDAEVAAQIGWLYHRLGDAARALASCRDALAIDPSSATAHSNLGLILLSRGARDEALHELERGVEIEPTRIEALRALALGLMASARCADAAAIFERILALAPADAAALLGLGNAYAALEDLPRANAAYRAAMAAAPGDLVALGRLCLSLLASRYEDEAAAMDEAGRLARAALDSGQDAAPIFSELQTVFERMADFGGLARLGDPFAAAASTPDRPPHSLFSRVETAVDRRRLVALHRAWGNKLVDSIEAQSLVRPRARRRTKLRIGLMSSDLRDHPIAYFALPLIEQYDRNSVEIYCYSFYPGPTDRVQSHIAGKVDRFTLPLGRSDEEVARLVAEDELDVLFELGGFTKHNRIEIMGFRMAPVQASWLGYPHSAGLPTIDRILVDPYLKPPDPALLGEAPFEMPKSWVSFGQYGFFDIAIDETPPAVRNGDRISFGTMNNPAKFTPACIAAWASVLDRTDGARFVIVRPECRSPLFRRNVAAEFAHHGIAADRLAFIPNRRGHHLTLYNEIDIALDPFPQTGGTTTCESLWMGVPVVTLVGEAFFERLSYSNLGNAGLGDLCGYTVEDYVGRAVALARDAPRRKALRRGLREQVRRSPLGQGERWVRHFEQAARDVAGR